ncbi:MAG TPA: hypothetical protein PLL66_02785 [Bacteroidales bacterium]|nr:hypothetical protein [Bacteroidales bacterium]
MKNMQLKVIGLTIISLILCTSQLFSQEKTDNKEKKQKVELKPYGFLKGDAIYSTSGVNSFGGANLSAPQIATSNENSAMGFTAQHTRIGLKGSTGEKVKAGGVVEIDFFGGPFDANTKPRLRLAYASVSKGGFELRMGQQWDLFSPNNATTNNTNGNMWFAGNYGFRRAQLQASYKFNIENIFPMIQISVGETAKDIADLGKDNFAGIPMVQGRLSVKIKDKYTIGFSGVYGTYKEFAGTIIVLDTLKNDFNYYTTGIGVDINLPIHKYFSLNAEFNTGKNLNNANLFSVAGNHSWNFDAGNVVQNDKSSMGMWLNAVSELNDHFTLVIGYGMDKYTNETIAAGSITNNSVIYGNLCYNINHGFSLALEFQNISTKYEAIDAQTANVISLAGKLAF